MASVEMRTLLGRINAALRKKEGKWMSVHGWQAREYMGYFYMMSVTKDCISGYGISPVKMGRNLGVLRDDEDVTHKGRRVL